MLPIKQISIVLYILIIPLFIYAHGGRTDSHGGHNNRKTGGYHYHNAGSVHTADNPYQNHNTCGICNEITAKDKITFLQKKMKDEMIFNGEITGIIDDETIEAIKKIQNKIGISQTGIITQYLLDELTE